MLLKPFKTVGCASMFKKESSKFEAGLDPIRDLFALLALKRFEAHIKQNHIFGSRLVHSDAWCIAPFGLLPTVTFRMVLRSTIEMGIS